MLRLGDALYKVDGIENFKLEKPTKDPTEIQCALKADAALCLIFSF